MQKRNRNKSAAQPARPPTRRRREVALSAAEAVATPQLHHRVIHWLDQLSLGRLSKFTTPSSRETHSAGIMRYWDLQLKPDIVEATEL